jgi:hypothetical protein
MCIGNTTSPAANSTINWYPRQEERVTTLQEGAQRIEDSGANLNSGKRTARDSLTSKPKAQSSRTTGGAY